MIANKDPDNYTDPPTFLSHLQRNPRLLPYDFWPLVADSTVIVQHVCSVAIFVCCFVGIVQDRVSPVSVVGWASAGTVLGWVFWDMWVGQEESNIRARIIHDSAISHYYGNGAMSPPGAVTNGTDTGSSSVIDMASVGSRLGIVGNAAESGTSTRSPSISRSSSQAQGLGLSMSPITNGNSNSSSFHSQMHSRNLSASSIQTASSSTSPVQSSYPPYTSVSHLAPPLPPAILSTRNQQRLATAKSAILIYCALLGLSPILKSLTKSTTSDSIWAISCWLMCINVFFFDYGGGVGVKFPASLSTNAALMASTVLASRLPSTTHVFSLTLFSIEVFGLFPVFRRHLRHRSWRLHVTLTLILIVAAGWGLGITLVGEGLKAGAAGVVVWGLGSAVAMGGCSWWLIGL